MYLIKGFVIDSEKSDFPSLSRQAPDAEVPSKFVTETLEVPLMCQAFYVDMEGLNDGRAIKTIVPQVNPRKMVKQSLTLGLLPY